MDSTLGVDERQRLKADTQGSGFPNCGHRHRATGRVGALQEQCRGGRDGFRLEHVEFEVPGRYPLNRKLHRAGLRARVCLALPSFQPRPCHIVGEHINK